MQITIDTNNLSELDIAMLAFLAEQEPTAEVAEEPEPEPAPTKPAKAASKPKPEPEPEVEEPAEEPEEDLISGDAPTMSDAVAAATELVSDGKAALVKEALASVGAKRVSELAEGDIAAFLAALQK